MQEQQFGREDEDASTDALSFAQSEPLSILLVEDEGIVAQDLHETLIHLGYRVAGT